MFYRIREDKLYDWADYKYAEDCLETDIITQTEYQQHPNKVIVDGGVLVLNPDYDEEETAKREADFKSNFFNIEGFGWYRKQPKGYQSAIESLNTAFNRFTVMQKMGIEVFPANVFIFYTQPDFTKPEECTEEWLVAHQTKNEEMTVLEFGNFYATFTDAWNTEEHE